MTRSDLGKQDFAGMYRANWLLAALEPTTLQLIRPHLSLVTLKPGQVLYKTGATITDSYFPINCLISLHAVTADGTSVEVCSFGRDGVAAYGSTLTGTYAFGWYIAHLGGTALKIKTSELFRITRADDKLRDLIRLYIQVLIRQTFQTVACNSCHPVEARCSRVILSISDRTGEPDVPLTHEVLAEILGVQRSTISLVAKSLADAGLIAQHRGGIRILNRAKLTEACCECYDANRLHYRNVMQDDQPV